MTAPGSGFTRFWLYSVLALLREAHRFEHSDQPRGPRRGGPSLREVLKSRRGGNPGEA